jgi:hypothetical protein
VFPLPLVVHVRPSRQWRLLLVTFHLAAGLALWLADVPAVWQAAGTAVLAASLFAWQRRGHGVTLRCKADGKLEIQSGDGRLPVEAYHATMLAPGLALLHCTSPGVVRRRSWVLLADSLAAQDFRRLRVWLRHWDAMPGGDGRRPAL